MAGRMRKRGRRMAMKKSSLLSTFLLLSLLTALCTFSSPHPFLHASILFFCHSPSPPSQPKGPHKAKLPGLTNRRGDADGRNTKSRTKNTLLSSSSFTCSIITFPVGGGGAGARKEAGRLRRGRRGRGYT